MDSNFNRKKIVEKLYKTFRKLIHLNILKSLNSKKLKGIIEIDESLIYKTKYWRRGRRYSI